MTKPSFSKYLLSVNNWKNASWVSKKLRLGCYFNAFCCDDGWWRGGPPGCVLNTLPCGATRSINYLKLKERTVFCVFFWRWTFLSSFLLEASQINERTSWSACYHWCTCGSHGGGRAAHFESWSGSFLSGSSFLVQSMRSYEEGKMRIYLVGVLAVAGFKDENVTSSLPHFMTSSITSKL